MENSGEVDEDPHKDVHDSVYTLMQKRMSDLNSLRKENQADWQDNATAKSELDREV